MSFALQTEGLSKAFGGFRANSSIDLRVRQGSRHALIGPNGAGKTTFINLLTGALPADSGKIRLHDQDITRLSVHARVKAGMARTFQINQLFGQLSPIESVGLALSARDGLAGAFFEPFGAKAAMRAEAEALLERMRLADVMTLPTRELAYGKQRLLEIALALAARPKLLLLDEPAAGVPEGERHEILAIVAALPENVTVLLIEHDMELVFAFADRISVLVQGALFAEGDAREIAADKAVRAVYLGEEPHG